MHYYINDLKDVYFNTDGCSSGPLKYFAKYIINRNYACMCVDHDFDYSYGWKYGISRAQADRWLYEGVRDSGHPAIAWAMYVGVRAVGWRFYRTNGR